MDFSSRLKLISQNNDSYSFPHDLKPQDKLRKCQLWRTGRSRHLKRSYRVLEAVMRITLLVSGLSGSNWTCLAASSLPVSTS